MSQPEMQPEGPPQVERGERGGAGRDDDLAGRPFPLGDWGEPAERLDELYRWVERGALTTAEWYLRDRTWKRRGARALRAGTALGAVVGAALPVLDLTRVVGGVAPWGCLALLLAVACAVGDRYFGLTAGWMRDVATAQAVQRRLQALQFDWASECVREVLGPTEGTAGEAAERCLGVLRRFSEDLTELVRAETADWMVQFRSGALPLGMRAGCADGGARMPEGPPPGRLLGPPVAPGARPNMPRQRPPEPR
ncbi:SLATT domain-containing protein [Streptomyces himalayensis]|uniref:SLATT domain-containing protein n=2 Tax=Streptomyces himalayensis TaxID=2820085 RepID=A0A7W2D8S4_9ACTN|nr:SLATT domain-containing protein [Streptomyces himalayensis]MBA2945141.1 SLATT domain-containing protein [Streptomyces himalayensis subsp. himalayensis]MBA4866647.1 SLATT domain-containing protein [Streptomyces himalayensis subsp. aureolus]